MDSREPVAWEWWATGTRWRIHHDGGVDDALADRCWRLVTRDEARWSRFLPGSEVSAVTAQAGRQVRVSEETVRLVAACREWMERTGGVFNPLVGGRVAAWGYARDMARSAPGAACAPAPAGVPDRLEVDPAGGWVRIPAGTALDLGGIAKGWIADRVAGLLRGEPGAGCALVDAGGDIVAARGGHEVAVDDLDDRLWLDEGQAVATSGWRLRAWRTTDGREAHHLIDPATGDPGPLTVATVVHHTAAGSDVWAKTVALRPHLLNGLGLPAMVRTEDGAHHTPEWVRQARRGLTR
ncbi:MAG: FAD:protein FMN transferase [Thermoleophilia bacterium]